MLNNTRTHSDWLNHSLLHMCILKEKLQYLNSRSFSYWKTKFTLVRYSIRYISLPLAASLFQGYSAEYPYTGYKTPVIQQLFISKNLCTASITDTETVLRLYQVSYAEIEIIQLIFSLMGNDKYIRLWQRWRARPVRAVWPPRSMLLDGKSHSYVFILISLKQTVNSSKVKAGWGHFHKFNMVWGYQHC